MSAITANRTRTTSTTTTWPSVRTLLVMPAALLLLLVALGAVPAHGLECVICGEYNDDGVGAITPCLNYSAELVPRLRKTCPRPEHKHCIVSARAVRGKGRRRRCHIGTLIERQIYGWGYQFDWPPNRDATDA